MTRRILLMLLSSCSIGSSKFTAGIIEIGTELRIGGKEIEVDMPISAEE